MAQHLETVESSSSNEYKEKVNELISDGYVVQTTAISKRDVGSYDEFSVFQAILIKETDE